MERLRLHGQCGGNWRVLLAGCRCNGSVNVNGYISDRESQDFPFDVREKDGDGVCIAKRCVKREDGGKLETRSWKLGRDEGG